MPAHYNRLLIDLLPPQVETRMPNEPRELVVYHDDAARPAYMLMLK